MSEHRRTLLRIFAIMAGAVLVLLVVLPAVYRSRMVGGEAPVIGDMRTMSSAQAAYAASNGEYYDRPACLARPSGCLRGWDDTKPTFLDPGLAALGIRNGYARFFHAGPPVARQEIEARRLSPTSLRAFAYVARPLTAGARTFCVDARGMVCDTLGSAGLMPDPKDGVCPAECRPLH